MNCKLECPDEPHYHIDDSGPICGAATTSGEDHPKWCIAQHIPLEFIL